MARKKKPLPLLENITITGFAAEGKAITKIDDLVVFVPYAAPGDVVDIQIKKKKHRYAEAEIVNMVKPSSLRIKPFCKHFGICGGCKWQHIPYEEQLKMKQQQVFDQLSRIGKVDLPEFNAILGSVHTQQYRNKLEFGCSNKRWLTKEQISTEVEFDNMNAIGFHISGAFDKILPIDECFLMDDLNNKIRKHIYHYAIENQLHFYDIKQNTGFLRDIMVRNSNTNEWMVLIQFKFESPDDQQKAESLLENLRINFPQITSLLYVDNQKCNDTFGDQQVILFSGKDYIMEQMDSLQFKVAAKSFYQTNTEQAYHLYEVARNFAKLTGNEIVYDLYTGTGTIANFVAKQAKKVVGIEYVEDAIADAKVNSEINNITNTAFFAGDMKDILTDDFIELHGKPDVIITDPPRAGMHQDVVETILRAEPQKIVYVSCNPATQARDLDLLDTKYQIIEVQPVDMFPHTPHVENVVLLSKR